MSRREIFIQPVADKKEELKYKDLNPLKDKI